MSLHSPGWYQVWLSCLSPWVLESTGVYHSAWSPHPHLSVIADSTIILTSFLNFNLHKVLASWSSLKIASKVYKNLSDFDFFIIASFSPDCLLVQCLQCWRWRKAGRITCLLESGTPSQAAHHKQKASNKQIFSHRRNTSFLAKDCQVPKGGRGWQNMLNPLQLFANTES